ncbi:DUF748 domain-containing protein [Bowmanella dokdonensis]|uniref:DUF748 domain-containing protein n=1 Tax=Bowmanella dokdonensis TaxID=751969 RepID=A0A939ISP6_9ALTE|nr:DUF748 domain-containing protein [Bowmanella dokdonensis]MBN7826952.1 DUF748 domain-containing protein [Bowmanella dokdonensis]
MTRKRKFAVLIGFLLVLLAVRMAAPVLVEQRINQAIAEAEGLRGSISEVDLHLYRGAYRIRDVQLYSVNGVEVEPLISIDRVELSLLWSALIDGEVVAEMTFHQPKISVIQTPDKPVLGNEAVKDESTWITLANKLVPFSIDRLSIVDGTLLFKTSEKDKQASFHIGQLDGHILNITNSLELSDSLMAKVNLSGKVMDESRISIKGAYNPYETKPTFNLDMQMERLPVKRLDGLIRYYTPFDLEQGELDMAMEIASNQGEVNGYVKGGLHDVEVFDWEEDVEKDGDNPFQWIIEGITAALGAILESDKTGLVATRVPLEGSLNDLDTPLLPAIVGLFRNAFIEAYEMKIEDVIFAEFDD